jgi:capsular polysaccharide transport system permease protein
MQPAFEQQTLWQFLSQQRRVIYALMMREMVTRFGRDNLGLLWLIGEPMIFTVSVATLWTAAGLSHAVSVPPVAFAVTGYSSVLMWRNAASHSSMAITHNKALLYHRVVLVIDVITRIVREIAGATCSFILLSAVCIYVGWMPMPSDMSLLVAGWLMLAWFGASLALLIGAGTAFSVVVERFWMPISYIMFPMSGAAFMVDWLPKRLQDLVSYLPMVHGVEMLRAGFFGNLVTTHYDVGYMARACLLLTLGGMFLLREAIHRAEF